MKKLASLLVSFFLSGLLANSQFTIDQITQFGSTSDQVPAGMSISNGALYISGNDAGQSMILKYGTDNIGSLVWNLKWPGTASVSEMFGGVSADANGVYASGYSYAQTTDGVGGKEHKSILCKFPANGATGSGVGGTDWMVKPMFFSYKGYENYQGNLLIKQQDTSYIYSYGMAESGTGGNMTALLTKHDTYGNMKWQSLFGNQSTGVQGYAFTMCLLNNYLYIGGCENHFNVWKLDLNGTKIWSKTTEPTVPSFMMGICASDKHLYGAGYETIAGRGNEALIIKYDENGTIIWKKVWGGSLDDMANSIEFSNNTLWVVGETSSYGSGGKDAFILKLNAADGSVIDSVFGGGTQDDAALKILKEGSNMYISGTFQGSAKFGPATLTSNGGKDLFLIKMKTISTPRANPVTPDAHSVILDHFDGTTNGSLFGTQKFVQGAEGLSQAIELYKPGNYVKYSRNVNLETVGTVEMWVNLSTYNKGLLNINWSNTTSNPPSGHVFHMSVDSLGKLSLSNWGYSISNMFHGNSRIPLNTWTHIAVTWSDSTKIYINGKLDMASSLLFRPAIRGQAYYYVPYWGDSLALFDEFHVSNVVRTSTEIASRIATEIKDIVYTVTPGNLNNVLTSFEKANLRNLKLSGNIDARDIRVMRDSMPVLENLDLSGINIVEYTGTEGTRYGAKDTYAANTMPRNAFVLPNGKISLKTVIQPSNLTEIGRSAYSRCYNLTTINWPVGLQKIGYAAFNDCNSLLEAVIPQGVTIIDTVTFRYCRSLKSITIPAGIREIRYGAFLQCNELASPIFEPNSQLAHIGFYAFGICPKITNFVLPPMVRYIGNVAFLGTSAEVTVSPTHRYFTNIDGVLYDKALTRLQYCPSMKTGRVEIPQTVVQIAGDAFYNCRSLDSITMPPNLKIIEDWAFENCTGLRTLTIPASVTDIWAYAFYNCSGLKALYVNTPAPVNLSSSDSVFNYIDKNACTLYVLSGLKSLYQAADKWKEFSHVVEVSDAVAVTPGNLHKVWSKEVRAGLKRLNLTGSIDARDFKTMRDSMPLLEYIDLKAVSIVAYSGVGGPWNVADYAYAANKIPEGAFNTANSNYHLKTIILPDNLQVIGRSAFNRCYGLSTVVVGPNVHTIERYAFVYCTSMKDITLPGSLRSLLYGAFARTGLTNILLPEGVKFIGEYSFQSCPELESITLPSTVEYIGYCAITFNDRLKAINVAVGNPTYASLEGVLYDKAMKTLVSFPNMKSNYFRVPEGVQAIDTAAFEGCWALRSIELPSTLKRICLEAFYNCGNLESVEIPVSVTGIESYAFTNCNKLKLVSARASSPVDLSAATSLFEGVDLNACILRVPNGSKLSYQAANVWNTFSILAEDLSKTVSIAAGGLYNALTPMERNAVTHLKINGTLDARDFKTMRENLPMLAEVDITGAAIAAYNGSDGTRSYSMSYKANAIPPDAFFFRDREGDPAKHWLTKFLMPTTVTEIGDASFTNCGLRSIVLHEGITNIEPWAFYGCRLNALSLPASLSSIKENCFGSNPNLQSFTVASGNLNFMERNGMLYDKAGSTLLYYPNARGAQALIPNGTETIQARAFEGCDFVLFINVSSEVKNIVAPAFNFMSNLLIIGVEDGNGYYRSINGVLYDNAQKVLLAYPNKKGSYFDIPYGVEEVGAWAFGGSWNLNEVNLPQSVVKIAHNAFQYCANLNVLLLPYSVNSLESEAFADCYNLKKITVNRGMPIDLNSSPNVFRGVDVNACVLRVPQNAYWNYRSANQWGAFFNVDEAQQRTYLVRVPAGTKACYIAGEMNGWNQQAMNKEFSNFYRIELIAHQTDEYKYCSGPDWMYEELDLAGNTIDNRRFQFMDTVLSWRNVYQPWMPYSPWKIQVTPTYSIGKIQFVSPAEGWIASGNDNGLLHSTDGGDTWNKVVPFPDDLAGNFSDPAVTMDWISPTQGWAMKTLSADPNSIFGSPNGAVLYSTTNGGTTWSKKAFSKSKPTITYTNADFQGTWQIHEIMEAGYNNSSTLFSGWCHLKMTVGTDGTSSLSEGFIPSGPIGDTSQPYELLPDGSFTLKGTDLNGFLNADKTTGFLTMTNEIGSHVFGVMQKQIPNTVYSTSDLQGTWQMHILKVGNPATQSQGKSGWMYAIASIDASGNAQLNMMSSSGEIISASAPFSITPDGFVSVPDMSWHGYMNADKTAFYSTFTDDGGKAFDLCIMQKQVTNKTYHLGDLEGVWRVHEMVLADANDSMSGSRLGIVSLNIQKDGSGRVTNSDKGDEDNEDNNVQFSISSTGIVTVDSMVAHGYLNAQKNAIVFTMSDDNNASMLVMQKDSTYSGDMGLQVQFADQNNGWASTYNWLTSDFNLYRTTNGGNDWNAVPNKNTVGFFDFVDANNGWTLCVPTDSATNPTWSISRTTDGGLNWTKQYVSPDEDDNSLNALQFTDVNHGWVTGNNGKLLKTEDGGEHWSAVNNTGLSTGSESKALYFLNANVGWVAVEQKNGEGLLILHTTDGGANWSVQNTNLTDGSLFSLFFWDENHGWFTGETLDETSEERNYKGIIGVLENGAIKIGRTTVQNDLELYPNPVTDGFRIRSLEEGALVSIYQLNGTVVLKQRSEGDGYFNVSNLKKGMYLVRIATTDGVVNLKLVKK